jgi:integrase
MKRTKDRLSAKGVEALVKKAVPGRHADGGGLYLAISPQGHARWTFLYKRGPKQTEIGIHTARSRQGLAALADARAAAARFRDMLTQGIAPKVGKRPVVTMTFADCADAAMKTRKWRHPKTSKQWRHQLTVHCASIRDVPVIEITKDHVVSVLEPLWSTKQVTAVNLRSRIEFVLGWATANKHRSGDNPARWKNNLQFFLPSPAAPVKHFAAMDYRDTPNFVAKLQQQKSVPALALEFLIHTACRLNEVLGAKWDEIELNSNDGPVWTIPGSRMKMAKEHRVPLSARCV